MSIIGNIFNIKRDAIHDGPNIRTTIFLKGCALACWWCHNPEGKDPSVMFKHNPRKSFEFDDEQMVSLGGWSASVDEVMEEILKDKPFFDQSGGGVTISGGDPLYQPEFLLELLKACGQAGIHRTVDTAAYTMPTTLESINYETDLWLVDLKHMNNDEHEVHTGVANTTILENIRLLDTLGANARLRLPLIPGVNDDQDHLAFCAEFVSTLKNIRAIDILPYHSTAVSKYKKLGLDSPRMPQSRSSSLSAEKAVKLMEAHGLKAQLGG
jgi:pyruvate formate lyase activating enzyme